MPASPLETADPSSADLRRSQRRRALGRQWDDLLLKARALPGLDSFLKPQTFESLRHAADDGPVVTVNISRYRCDALILRQDGLTVLPLRDLSHTAVRERALALDEVLRNRSAADAHAEVRATLSWLWKVIAEPVTGMLGLGGGPPVRMWWCATGMLTFLPVHAAGRYPGRTTGPAAPTTLLDFAVSSYTPTLRALVDARLRVARRRPTSRPGILAVAVPDAEGLERLPHATVEVDRLRDLFPEVTTLVGQDATRTAILAELPGHDWLHFAGHGSQDLLNPGSAALYCHDHRSAGPLTALAVSRLRLHDAELAFLSACETARGSAELTDESAHIAGALNIAGFPHVIAAQWEISDTRAPFVAEHVYRYLTADDSGAATARDAARALHSAVNALRSLRPDAAALWAPYIHTGP
ncbi:CHAT domain-containing protein [Streptomyces europaeiscabiei]|uniref:CHAT domain-containing protein n=1 Tax=Streptomyces europaeiscabiei TaxID=146819 RepID=UPI0038F70D38